MGRLSHGNWQPLISSGSLFCRINTSPAHKAHRCIVRLTRLLLRGRLLENTDGRSHPKTR